MKSVGEIIKCAREAKHLSLDEVAEGTKIRLTLLQAIEVNDFCQFESKAVSRGLIKNYAEYLGLNSESIMAVFKRDFIDKGLCKYIGTQSKFYWTPKTTMIMVVTVVAILLIIYLAWQYFSLQSAPY